jgi:hypothetical protein
MSRNTRNFTTDQINNFTPSQLGQLLIAYGDGQGDTYLKSLGELYEDYGFSTEPYMKVIDEIYEEHGGNMVEIAWIEDNRLLDVVFLD